jgi:hypothetical protein
MDLSEYINDYPDRRNSEYQEIIDSMYEFISLSYTGDDSMSPGEKYFRTQRLVHRLMKEYTRMILIDRPGTGKSCTALGVAEMCVAAVILAALNPDTIPAPMARIKTMYVIVRNTSIKEEMIFQLACRCTDGRYKPEPGTRSDQIKSVKRKFRKVGYRVLTYGEFTSFIASKFGFDTSVQDRKAKFIEKLDSDPDFRKRVEQEVSDCWYWIDEAHNLVSSESKGQSEASGGFKENYTFIHTILSIAKRIYLIISTATPAINNYTEAFKVFNLAVDRDGVIPEEMDPNDLNDHEFGLLFPYFPKNKDRRTISRTKLAKYYLPQFPTNYQGGDYDGNYVNRYITDKIEEIPNSEKYIENLYKLLSYTTQDFMKVRLRGMMSYVRDLNPDYKVEVMTSKGNKELERQMARLGFYTLRLSTKQTNLYDSVANIYTDEISGRKNRATIFVFPDTVGKSVGKDLDGYNKHFTSDNKIMGESSLKSIFRNDRRMKNYGGKLLLTKNIVEESDGLVVIVCDHVKGAGCWLVSAYLQERLDLRYYDGKEPLLADMVDEEADYCSGEYREESLVAPDFGTPAVCVLTSETSPSENSNIKAAATSPYNIFGALVKVVIISEALSEGVSFQGARSVVLLNSKWTDPSREQAESRAIRVDSFKTIGPILRDQHGEEEHTIRVYRLVALRKDGSETVDVTTYLAARSKGLEIKIILRHCKMLAVTCKMNKGRNQRAEDVDYSAECDYLKCGFPCNGEGSDRSVDYTGYDLLYSSKDVEDTISKISKVFIFSPEVSLPRLKEVLKYKYPDLRDYIIERSITEMVMKKIPVKDRYGMQCYVREDKDKFVLDPDYPSDIFMEKLSYHYTEEINTVKRRTVAEIANEMTTYSVEEMERIIGDEELSQDISVNGSIHNKAQLMEYVIKRRLMDDPIPESDMSETFTAMYDLLIKFFYTMKEPVDEFISIDAEIKNPTRSVGRGITRMLEEGYTSRLMRNESILNRRLKNKGATKVWFHTLYGQKASLGKGNISNNFINPPEGVLIRVIRKSLDNNWRDATPLETAVYRRVAHISNATKMRGLAGGMDETGKLDHMLAFKLTDPGVKFIYKTDANSKLCNNMEVVELLGLAYKNGLIGRDDDPPPMSKSARKGIVDEIVSLMSAKSRQSERLRLNELSDKELYDYQYFLMDNRTEGRGAITKKSICEILYERLREAGYVFEGEVPVKLRPLPYKVK